jgi:hypothetical protein
MKAEAPARDRSFAAAVSPDFDPGAAVTRAIQVAVANAVAFVAAKRSAADRLPASPIAASARARAAGASSSALAITDLHRPPQLKPPQLAPSRLGAVRDLDRRTGPKRLATERTHAS